MAFPRMLRLIAATPFFPLPSPDSLSTNTPAYTNSSIESHHIPSVVFSRVCHPRFRSTDFFCSLLSSFVFRRLRRRHSPSANRTLFSNQSSLPLVPFPGNRRPRRFKQQNFKVTKNLGQKLNAYWEGPFRLVDVSRHQKSGRLQDLLTGEIVQPRKAGLGERMHVNDMKLFDARGNILPHNANHVTIDGVRTAADWELREETGGSLRGGLSRWQALVF